MQGWAVRATRVKVSSQGLLVRWRDERDLVSREPARLNFQGPKQPSIVSGFTRRTQRLGAEPPVLNVAASRFVEPGRLQQFRLSRPGGAKLLVSVPDRVNQPIQRSQVEADAQADRSGKPQLAENAIEHPNSPIRFRRSGAASRGQGTAAKPEFPSCSRCRAGYLVELDPEGDAGQSRHRVTQIAHHEIFLLSPKIRLPS
jgi:hypothetical protein